MTYRHRFLLLNLVLENPGWLSNHVHKGIEGVAQDESSHDDCMRD